MCEFKDIKKSKGTCSWEFKTKKESKTLKALRMGENGTRREALALVFLSGKWGCGITVGSANEDAYRKG